MPEGGGSAGLPVESGSPTAASFGALLRRLRLRAGLSQAALAERAGLGLTTLAALERDLRPRPRQHTLDMLANALGLPPAERTLLLDAAADNLVVPPAPAGPSRRAAAAKAPIRLVRLPVPPTTLIGRAGEVAHLRRLLDPRSGSARLLTLVGPGGVGKTRLALAVAAELVERYADGVVFVDLTPLHDSRLVPATLAHALAIHESRGRSARDLLLEYLRERQLLLVLDNFEHLMPASNLLAEFLAACPRLVLLLTSRAALRLRTEQRFVVAPLATPGLERSVETIAASPSVRLFVDRARVVDPSFELSGTNARDVAAICERLDGLPLAIELAAARVGLLEAAALLLRLEYRLPLLTEGAADLPERQQTLRTTLAWSFELLDSQAQVLFRRLSVFAGGCTLEAAEGVASDGALSADSVLDQIQVLVDSSLAYPVDLVPDEPRVEMLETVRELAAAYLRDSGEQTTIRNRHLDFYLALAEQATLELFGPALAAWLERLDRDVANLRTALEWAWDQRQIVVGLRLAGALAPFWRMRGHASEGRAQLTRLIAAMDDFDVPATVRARALDGAGVLANTQGDQRQAMQLLDRAVQLYREAGDPLAAVRALNSRGGVDYDRGDLQNAMARYLECEALAREANDLGEVGRALGNVGEVHYHLGELDRATACHQDALALARRAGRVDVEAYQLSDLANVAVRRGDLARAFDLHRQALTLKRRLADHRRVAISLEDMAALAVAEGRLAHAGRLLGAASELRAAIGAPLPEPERATTERTTELARAELGNRAWTTEFETGRTTPLDEIVAEALGERVAAIGQGPVD
jgi:predicted ATPase/transcriptional regulator with XRE-family HTH domain